MYAVIGIVLLIVMVFGGFALTGGALGPVMEAIPHEMLIIGGAAVAALVTGNSLHQLKAIGGGFKKVFKGPRHSKQDHIDAIALTTKLMRLLRAEGPVALESHVQEPETSTIFAEYPSLLANKPLIELICDPLTLLVVSSGSLETHAVEDVMDNALRTHFHEQREPCTGIPDRSHEPQGITRTTAAPQWDIRAGPADCRQTEHLRRSRRQRDGVSADKRQPIALAGSLDPVEECHVPFLVA